MAPNYSKLEDLLYQGFLTLKGGIGGVPVVFKSLNEKERELILMRSGDSYTSQVSYQIAYSLLFFNGTNILSNREEYFPFLLDYIKEFPSSIKDTILIRLKYLNQDAAERIEYVRPYTYGPESKNKWLALREGNLNSPSITGIQGTENLGLNTHQQLWLALHSAEEKQEEFDRNWEVAAFQASAWNPDGIKKVRRKRKSQRKKDRRKEKALYNSKGETDVEEHGREIRIYQESPDELLEQMERDNQGVKDFHDRVIEEHEEEIRNKAIEEERKWQERKMEAHKKREERLKNVSSEGMVVLDENEAEERAEQRERAKKKHQMEGNYAKREAFDDKVERLQKWGIIEGEDKLKETGKERAKKLKEDDEGESNNGNENVPESMSGTILEDHYRKVDNDLKNPESTDLPDILDEE